MEGKQLSKEEALQYCFGEISQANLGAKEYNHFKQYIYRHRDGKLNDKAVRTLFDRFNVVEQCTYSIKINEDDPEGV